MRGRFLAIAHYSNFPLVLLLTGWSPRQLHSPRVNPVGYNGRPFVST